MSFPELNADQRAALEILKGQDNVFVTGAAGSGKSFLMRAFLRDNRIPILASTGAAAILVGGRTFHSFFGLGIMEGGVEKTVHRALGNKRVVKRLEKVDAIIIDEISMISGPTLQAAEGIARSARGSPAPWGGLRVIAVGDFAQLPPVNPFSRVREWAFLSEIWKKSAFRPVLLKQIMRTQDGDFLEVLNDIRVGRVTDSARRFLQARVQPVPLGELTCLFALRDQVDSHNLSRLEELPGDVTSFQTLYEGEPKDIETFKKHSPVGDVIHLKKGALVMLRQNDNDGRWVNGTTGSIVKITEKKLAIRLHSGRARGEVVDIERADFTLLNAEGQAMVTAKNFPVSLAWAMTIHKAQGATLDRVQVRLTNIFEAGQAYVALSRARDPNGLYIDDWNPRAIFADPHVTNFHAELEVAHASTIADWESASFGGA